MVIMAVTESSRIAVFMRVLLLPRRIEKSDHCFVA
jgi:hypothetical protein